MMNQTQTSISFKEAFVNKISGLGISSGELLLNILIAIVLIIIGIFVGKIVKFILRNLAEKVKLDKLINKSFINLFLVVVKWSIYILFINFALIQLDLPIMTNWLTTILGVIPALTGALIIISVGFAIAAYLKKIIEESKVREWKILSEIFFYFINYVFIIFALRTALISIKSEMMINGLILILSFLAGVALIFHYIKIKK